MTSRIICTTLLGSLLLAALPVEGRTADAQQLLDTLTTGEIVRTITQLQSQAPYDEPAARPYLECTAKHNLARWMTPAIDTVVGADPDSIRQINQFLATQDGMNWLSKREIDFSFPLPQDTKPTPVPDGFLQNGRTVGAGNKLSLIATQYLKAMTMRSQQHFAEMYQACHVQFDRLLQNGPSTTDMQRAINRPAQPAGKPATPQETRRFLELYLQPLPDDYLDDLWNAAFTSSGTATSPTLRHCAVRAAWLSQLMPKVATYLPDAALVRQGSDLMQTTGMQRMRAYDGTYAHIELDRKKQGLKQFDKPVQDAVLKAYRPVGAATWILYDKYIRTTHAGEALNQFMQANMRGPRLSRQDLSSMLASCGGTPVQP